MPSTRRLKDPSLYRLHADFWFWGQEYVCQDAWKAMVEFTNIMGIQFNEEKIGTVRLSPKAHQRAKSDTSLSKDTTSTTDMLSKDDVCWGCFISTPTQADLCQTKEQRFAVKDLPDGFFYFPPRTGRLELKNPLIPLFGLCDSLRKTPDRMLEKALDKDEEAYHIAREQFSRKDSGAGRGRYSNFELARNLQNEGKSFMPMDEYLRYREETSSHLAAIYNALLQVPAEKAIDKSPQSASWEEGLGSQPGEEKRARGVTFRD